MERVVEARFATVCVMILVAFVFLSVVVRAVDYSVGVKVGDWIKFGQFSVTWSGNGTEPSYVTEDRKVDWVRMEVESVSGTVVTLNQTSHSINGTQTSQILNVDVAGRTGMLGFPLLIASNLEAGDPTVNMPNSPVINQTITERYAGASRNVNLIEATSTVENQTTSVKACWDQSTGIMVEMYMKLPYSDDSSGYVESSVKATETNMWSADFVGLLQNNLLYIVAGVVVVIVVVSAALVFRRRKAQPPPPPPEPGTTEAQKSSP